MPTIAGTLYQADGTTPVEGATIRVSIDGAAPHANTATTAANGTFSVASMVWSTARAVTVYVSAGGVSAVGVFVTANTTGAVSNLLLYADALILQRATGGGATIGAQIATSDNSGEAGITAIYSCPDSGTLTLAAGKSLHVRAGAGLSVTNAVTVTVPGSLTVQSGVTTGSTKTFLVGGNVTYAGSTSGSVDITLNGTAQTLNVTGGITFRDLTKAVAAADTLTFTAGTTTAVSGTLTLQGAAGQLLSLVSSSPGDEWTIDATGATTLEYLSVEDSTAATPLTAGTGSVAGAGGGNTGWTFPGDPVQGGGAAGALAAVLKNRRVRRGPQRRD